MVVGRVGDLRAARAGVPVHLAGEQRRAYDRLPLVPTTDRSTNCWWVALLGWGEGWHNNHHAFPFSVRHGLRWYELDVTWLMVKTLAALRLATELKLPTAQMMRHGCGSTAEARAA